MKDITKFVWRLRRYESSSPSSKELPGREQLKWREDITTLKRILRYKLVTERAR